jgi:phage FluMu protein Com
MQDTYTDALGYLLCTLRNLTNFEWLRIQCPHCGKEMTQYITPQEGSGQIPSGRSSTEYNMQLL